MAKKCDVCGRGTTRDASRSHSNIRTLKRQYVNLQFRTIGGKRTKVCASCIKTTKRTQPTKKIRQAGKKTASK